MARRAGTTKAETHETIVTAAAASLRSAGYAGLGVADVMAQAGLTHGGFYAHFASKDALVAEALARGADQSLERLAAAAGTGGLEGLVTTYLSDRHLAAPERGCALAALGSETPRQPADVRTVMTDKVRALLELVERHVPARRAPQRREQAMAVVACLVGALTAARAITDPALARAIRDAAARTILTQIAAAA